ncbi:Serine/threonine-protein kinase HT1 [Termitomyces sp. J132]|nr:Serine/threonine-protein kinase HT1 [Termitomyces sp. J132]
MNRIKAENGLKEAPKPCEYFDVIGGTGTGGLIAILLGRLCLSVEESIGAYTEFAGKVFSETKHKWQDGTFKASTFETVIKAVVARYDDSKSENAPMMSGVSAQRNCKTFVCATPGPSQPTTDTRPHLFRSYPAQSPSQSPNSTIWEAARATTASPPFFKRIEIGTSSPKEEYIDGGRGCTNPAFEVLKEAQSIYGMDHPVSCVVSVGAGHLGTVGVGAGRSDAFRVEVVRALEGISMDCERVAEDFSRVFSVQQGFQGVSLAEWTKMGDVKTHTMQYLRGVVVDAEIDRVRDLLKSAGSDEYRGRLQIEGQGVGLNEISSTSVLEQTLLKQVKVTSSLCVIFDTVAHYKCLLSCDEADAQKILDAFQTIYAREAILWAQLCHPNILPFYGLVQIGSRLAFVSRWATNGNLEDYLTSENPDANNRLLLCLDTAAGVEYLHTNDIVHGDLKGVNVLVDSSGRAALGDLGLASVTDPQILKWTTQSSVASKGGTVRWQAPELLDSEDRSEKIHNTKASDVFAWGSVCYEIFTGSVPYHQHRNQTTVMLSIQRGDTPRRPEDSDPAWIRHGLTDNVWNLMRNCWAFDPSKRPDMTRVISRLEVEKMVDFRLRGEWDDKVGMWFRNAQDGSEGAMDLFWEELDLLIKRVVPVDEE